MDGESDIPESEPVFVWKNGMDLGRKYATQIGSNVDKWRCLLCKKSMSGGVRRVKKHIGHVSGNVTACPNSSEEDKRLCKEATETAKNKTKGKKAVALEVRREVNIDDDDDCIVVGQKRKNLGPIDRFTSTVDIDDQLEKNRKQPKIKEVFNKQRWNRVAQLNAHWVYVSGVPFNSIHHDAFYQLCEAIGLYGPGYEPPSQYMLGGPLLKQEVEITKKSLKKQEEEWVINGCSILTDAWTDQRRRSIMNICVNCKEGTTFITSIEASGDAHTGKYIYDYVVKNIKELGEDKVVQVVTDNASNNMSVATLLKISNPNIFWTSCAAHTIDLMLEGIGGIKKFSEVIGRAKSLVIFIYAHHSTLHMMRKNTKKRDIIRPGATRFGTAFLTLDSLIEKQDRLRQMFVSTQWDASPLSKCRKGKTSKATVLSLNIWNTVKLCLKVFGPLVELLCIADDDQKPSMGFVFGELKRAKQVIKEVVNDNILCTRIMSIIEAKGKDRLDSPLHLVAYLLNPFYFYKDRTIEEEEGLTEGIFTCVEKFFPGDEEIHNIICNEELLAYKDQRGIFGKLIAQKSCAINHKKYDPVGWWSMYDNEVPNLKKMAKRILVLTSSSSGCERNWSTFERIHTKKRNRLDVARLNNLVYVQFNTKIIDKNKKRRSKGKPLKFLHGEDASIAHGWLVEGGDDEIDPKTELPWSIIGEASGADEMLVPRRTTRNQEPKELHDDDFISEVENGDENEEHDDEIEYEESDDD